MAARAHAAGFHRAGDGTERIARGRMQRRIHQLSNGESYVLATERRAIGKLNVGAQFKIDAAPIFRYRPLGGQLAFEFLGVAIQPDQHAAREVANGF